MSIMSNISYMGSSGGKAVVHKLEAPQFPAPPVRMPMCPLARYLTSNYSRILFQQCVNMTCSVKVLWVVGRLEKPYLNSLLSIYHIFKNSLHLYNSVCQKETKVRWEAEEESDRWVLRSLCFLNTDVCVHVCESILPVFIEAVLVRCHWPPVEYFVMTSSHPDPWVRKSLHLPQSNIPQACFHNTVQPVCDWLTTFHFYLFTL